MPIFTQAVTPSATVAAAHARFQQEIATWIAACMVRYAQSPATDVHDQGTYTTSWEPYIRATGDAAALAFHATQAGRAAPRRSAARRPATCCRRANRAPTPRSAR